MIWLRLKEIRSHESSESLIFLKNRKIRTKISDVRTPYKVDRKEVGIRFIEILTFIILFILLLLLQILCPHSISCFVFIFSY